MIVSVAILAWSVYTDQRTRRSRPPLASWVARQVHITLRKQDEFCVMAPNASPKFVATEITRSDWPPTMARKPHVKNLSC